MYIIVNNNKINIIYANTFYKKLKGFIGIKNIKYGMLFNNTNSLHTFFMKDNIDILAIDKKNTIIYKKENVPKNKIIIINNNFLNTCVIELPKNTINSLNIGDKLKIYK